MNFLVSVLPWPFGFFRPLVDILPAVPVMFLLLAFLWQGAVGFR